jgi:hypothetical protein
MSSIKKTKSEFAVIELKDEELFSIEKKDEIIKVYDQDILEKIVDDSFNSKYKKLLCLIMNINEDEDSTETDAELALEKIDGLRKYVLTHYSNLISTRNMNKYIKMLLLLESKISFNKRRGKSR